MSEQQIFNIAIGLAAFFGAWVLNNITKDIDRLESDVRAMPLQYVNRDDYRTDTKEIKELLAKIFDKLENKVDK